MLRGQSEEGLPADGLSAVDLKPVSLQHKKPVFVGDCCLIVVGVFDAVPLYCGCCLP